MYGLTFALGLLVGYLHRGHKRERIEDKNTRSNVFERLSTEELRRLARDIR